MPILKGVVAKLDDVPEAYRDRYEQKGDVFQLKEIDVEDVSGLKSALEKEKEERRKAKEALEKVKDVDLEEYQRLKKDAEDVEQKKLRAAGEFDKLKEKWDQQKAQEIGDLQKKFDEASRELRKLKIEDKVRAAALANGVFKDRVDDVVALTGNRFVLNEKGQIQVLDDDGDPMDVTVEKFFDSIFKEKKPWFYEASKAGGSGAEQTVTTKGGKRVVAAADQESINSNLEAIAKGEVIVQ